MLILSSLLASYKLYKIYEQSYTLVQTKGDQFDWIIIYLIMPAIIPFSIFVAIFSIYTFIETEKIIAKRKRDQDKEFFKESINRYL